MVDDLNLLLMIYVAVGCVIGGLMTWVPKRNLRPSWVYRLGLFFLMVIAWLPLALLSWIIMPIIRLCPCGTRH